MAAPLDTNREEEFVTTQEAARLLGVSVRTIQLWVESGVLHAWKTAGGHRRIARASVEDLRQQQREVIATASGLNVLKVVVLEDNPVYLELYRMKIESWQLPAMVTTAKNAFEGLIAVGRTKPDVMITDLPLAGVNGFMMIRALEQISPATRVIVATDLNDDDIAGAGGLPKNAIVLKQPIQFEALEELLRAKADNPRSAGQR